MATIIISDEAYRQLMDAAAQRGVSPDELITSGIQALDDHRLVEDHPLTADEFAASLGMTPEDVQRADEEARRRYPDLFTE